MVEVGKITIAGAIDTSNIDIGIERIGQGFERIRADSKKLFGSMSELAGVVRKLGAGLATISGIGAAGLGGLAAIAPSLAGTFAKMKVNFMKLANVAGKIFKPVFEAIAGDLLPSITDWFVRNQDVLTKWADVGAEAVGDVSKIISGQFDQIEDAKPKLAFVVAGAAAGFALAGFPGMLVGAAFGYALQNSDNPTVKKLSKIVEENWEDIKKGAIITGAGLTAAALGFKVGGFPGMLVGAAIGVMLPSIAEGGVGADLKRLVTGQWDEIRNALPLSASAIAGAAAGFAIGGFPGMLIGAALGAAISGVLIPDVSEEDIQKHGAFAETAVERRGIEQRLKEGGTGRGAAADVAAGFADSSRFMFNLFFDTIQHEWGNLTRKQSAYSGSSRSFKGGD